MMNKAAAGPYSLSKLPLLASPLEFCSIPMITPLPNAVSIFRWILGLFSGRLPVLCRVLA